MNECVRSIWVLLNEWFAYLKDVVWYQFHFVNLPGAECQGRTELNFPKGPLSKRNPAEYQTKPVPRAVIKMRDQPG